MTLRFWRSRSLAERYSRASATWHDGIRRLGYLHAYAELLTHAAATVKGGPLDGVGALAVLDAGCGSGALSLEFTRWQRSLPLASRRSVRVDLLDPSQQMLTVALAQHHQLGSTAHGICATIDELFCAASVYDVVLCSHVLEHAPDSATTLSRLYEVLRPGGILLLVVSHPHWCTRLLQLKWGSASWFTPQVCAMLRSSHFDDVSCVEFSEGPPSRTSRGYIARRAAQT
jgi:2-polyprenyl-3-methyl-5-hydroxy-6-metoxy-1,4-benzoquinol methylase